MSPSPLFSSEFRKSFADVLPHIVWASNPNGEIIFINRRGRDYFGLPASAIEGRAWTDALHPDDAERLAGEWERVGEAGQPFTLEYRLRRHDGEYRWHQGTGVPVRDEGGEIEAWVGTLTQIERRVRSERAALDAEREASDALALLDTLLNQAPVGFALVDADFRFIQINAALGKIYGLPAAEQIGRSIGEVAPEVWPQLRPHYERVLSSGEPSLDVTLIGETRARPGDTRHWRAGFFPVHGETALIGIGLVIVDATERDGLADQLEARLAQQAAVSELGQLTLRERSVERTMQAAVDTLLERLSADCAEILRAETGDPDLRLLVGAGWPSELVGEATVPLGNASQAGFTLLEDQPVVVPDLAEERRFTPSPLLRDANIVSGITTIIRVGGEPWGVLGVHMRRRREFGEHDVTFVRTVAHVVATALEAAEVQRVSLLHSTVLGGMAEGVMLCRLSEPVGTIEYANPQAARLLGYRVGELDGMLAPAIADGEMGATPQRRAEIRQRLARAGSWHGELDIRTKSGEERGFAVRVTLLDDYGVEAKVSVVLEDVTEARRAEGRRRRDDELRRRLLAELVHAQENERRRIAADIHDDSLQALSAIKLQLGLLRDFDGERQRAESIGALEEGLQEAITRLRGLLFELRPPALIEGGLEPALRDLLDELGRDGGPVCRLEGSLDAKLSLETRTIIYRIAREALVNARTHSGSDRVEVALLESDGSVAVRVRDFGVGFSAADEESRPGHLGLTTMRERAEIAGGWLHIRSRPGAGTTVEFAIPREPEPAAQ